MDADSICKLQDAIFRAVQLQRDDPAVFAETYECKGSFAASVGLEKEIQAAIDCFNVRFPYNSDSLDPLRKLLQSRVHENDLLDCISTLGALAASQLTKEALQAKVQLSGAESDIVEVIRDAGGHIESQSAVLSALSTKGKFPSLGTTKVTLAALKRHGILEQGPNGNGYQLPK